MAFDRKLAEKHLNALLKKHKIGVRAWSTTSCGMAWIKKREIKIPVPTNEDRFGVCMHEICHIIDGNGKTRFEEEFWCDAFAREQMELLGFDIEEWDKRTNWHVLAAIAKAVNNGMSIKKIPAEILKWFSEVDFSTWVGNKVFVDCVSSSEYGYVIRLTRTLPRVEIEKQLAEEGLRLRKSHSDDSTYGMWEVVGNEKIKHYNQFSNLTQIVSHYNLLTV